MGTSSHEFEMHPELLRSVIQKQAGTLDKAVLEGVMNSVDAGATVIDVTITHDTVVITDDGRGFASRTEVEEFFKVFGTPHKEGDATFGKFRMGRGQMFAFGHNTWRTGEFEMTVDVSQRLGFDLRESLPNRRGCEIVIKLYEELAPTNIHYMVRNITKMVKFIQLPIRINGERITVPIDPKKFPLTTDDAYINVTAARGYGGGVDVYNLGAYVETISSYKCGASGTVVSRKQLDVNFARNQVLDKCEVWRRIKPLFFEAGEKAIRNKTVLSEDEQANVIARLVSGELNHPDADSMRFLLDVTGKAWSPKMIRTKTFEAYSVADEGDQVGDKLMQTGRALVLDSRCVEALEAKPDQVFVKYPWKGMPGYAPMEKLSAGMNTNYVTLPKDQWRPTELVWVRLAERIMSLVAPWHEKDPTKVKRKVLVGTSDVALGWTDGRNYVVLAREFLSRLRTMNMGVINLNSLVQLAHVVMHEMCHDTDSRDNVHSPDFYRAYHDMVFAHLPAILVDATAYMTPAKYKNITKGLDSGENDAVQSQVAVAV
ncbi:MAG: ATP-binding protein [Armatimonadetes bacterium]|nr:ATP-binding protein [Armatimonadota bacterium]